MFDANRPRLQVFLDDEPQPFHTFNSAVTVEHLKVKASSEIDFIYP